MKMIIPNLYVGTIQQVPNLYLPPYKWRLVNVSKTLHTGMHAWKEKERLDNKPCYVYHEDPVCVSLNWVDAAARYFDYKNMGVINVARVLNFIHRNLEENQVIITCDQATSRAPSIALLYLAKAAKIITDESYEKSAGEFIDRFYFEYRPGEGMQEFLYKKWKEFSL